MLEKEPTLCIIDDTLEDRAIFRRYLLQDSAYRYRFYEEENGESGLRLCKTIQPDCVLLDFNLPDMDALEFLAGLSDERGSVPFAVIVLTGLSDETMALQAMQRGAQDYLVKDEMTPGNLYRAIHNAIERTSMRRTLEQQSRDLELKNQETQAFAYALAHDLRAPLRAISGFSQIINQDYRPALDRDGQRYVEHIIRATTQMDTLIEELLNYIRIEHRAVRRKPVDLASLLPRVFESLQARITETQARITLSSTFPLVSGDATLLNQVFLNLLDNALTYHHPGVVPQVTIGCIGEGAYVSISIADNGIGIPAKHHEKIFNLFQRLHGDDDFPGTGIGLAIVKKAVDLLGGSVWVESAPDGGSTFWVKLLLSQDL